MLCLIDEPLGCAKTFCPDSWVVACCHISYAVKDKTAISKATVANYFSTLMFKTLKKFERLKKTLISLELPNRIDWHKVSFYMKLKTEGILNFSLNTECEGATV